MDLTIRGMQGRQRDVQNIASNHCQRASFQTISQRLLGSENPSFDPNPNMGRNQVTSSYIKLQHRYRYTVRMSKFHRPSRTVFVLVQAGTKKWMIFWAVSRTISNLSARVVKVALSTLKNEEVCLNRWSFCLRWTSNTELWKLVETWKNVKDREENT